MKKRTGFTLAEMMVVLLVLSLILAAFLPIMTRRTKQARTSEGIWKWASNNVDIWYTTDNTGGAIIGADSFALDEDARLLLNKSSESQQHILFKQDNTSLAAMTLTNKGSLAISKSPVKVNNSVFIGQLSDVTGDNGVALGQNALVKLSNSIAIGTDSYNIQPDSVAIGFNSRIGTNTGLPDGSVAIGSNSAIKYEASVAIGHKAKAQNDNAVAIGYNAEAGVDTEPTMDAPGFATAVGSDSFASNGATALGANANAGKGGAVAIGYNAEAHANLNAHEKGAIAIGPGAIASAANSIAIGAGVTAGSANEIMLGDASHSTYIPGKLYIGTMATGASGAAVSRYSSTGGIYWTSDKRLKNIDKESKKGLEQIRELTVYDYVFKADNSKTPQIGVMAQDLQKVFPNSVTKMDNGFLAIKQDEMFYSMLNAIKQLDKMVLGIIEDVKQFTVKISQLDDKITATIKVSQIHSKEIKQLKDENLQLKKQNDKLEDRLQRLEKKIK